MLLKRRFIVALSWCVGR